MASSAAKVVGESCNYGVGASYWATQSCDVEGMLGGFGNLSQADVGDSRKFIRNLQTKHGVGRGQVLDCGSGIGRVTKLTLLPSFDCVDMVDVTDSFIDKSAEYLGPELNQRVRHKFVSGLQDFHPEKVNSEDGDDGMDVVENDGIEEEGKNGGVYDVVWIQWVSGYLNDKDFISFFQRCQSSLRPNGCIVVKENLCSVGDHDFDAEDSSYTRSRNCIVRLAERAGLQLIAEKKQTRWPQGMYEVRLLAFR